MSKVENELIGLLYESAAAPECWPEFIRELSNLTGAFLLNSRGNGRDGQGENEHFLLYESGSLPAGPSHLGQLRLGSEQARLFQALMPHVNRALLIQQRLSVLEREHQQATQLLDTLPLAIVVVDAEGKVLTVTRAAERLLTTSTQLSLPGGRLYINGESAEDIVREYGQASGQTEQENYYLLNCPGARPLTLLVTHHETEGHYVIYLNDGSSVQAPPTKLLQSLFDLTNSQAELCAMLVEGWSQEDIAHMRNTSLATVRTQFKTIYRKTRSQGQTDLVRKIMNSLVPFFPLPQEQAPSVEPQEKEVPYPSAQLILDDGRCLSYAEYGVRDGYPVIYCHSIFGSRFERPPYEGLTCTSNIRLIVPERPGYGLSDDVDDLTFRSWVMDLKALADHLGLERFAMVGLSLGCNFALAAADMLAQRVSYVSLVGVAPSFEKLSDLEQTSINYRLIAAMARYLPGVARLMIEREMRRVWKNPHQLVDRLLENNADKMVFAKPEVRRMFVQSFRQAAAHGAGNISREIILHSQPWAIDFSRIQCPVDVWVGGQDTQGPLPLVERTLAPLKRKHVHHMVDMGHFLIYEHWHGILVRLKQQLSHSQSEPLEM